MPAVLQRLTSLRLLMWTQPWPVTELESIDREVRKICFARVQVNAPSAARLLCPVKGQERAWPTSVEQRYKLTKTKAAVKVYQNPDLFMRAVQMFDEKAAEEWR